MPMKMCMVSVNSTFKLAAVTVLATVTARSMPPPKLPPFNRRKA